MAWDFETDADFRCDLDPVENPPRQKRAQQRGLWACHLGPDLGGLGYGRVNL